MEVDGGLPARALERARAPRSADLAADAIRQRRAVGMAPARSCRGYGSYRSFSFHSATQLMRSSNRPWKKRRMLERP